MPRFEDVPQTYCPACKNPRYEKWACPYCGYVHWRAITIATLIWVVWVWVSLFYPFSFLQPDTPFGVRVIACGMGTLVYVVYTGEAVYTMLHPHTRRARAVLEAHKQGDIEGQVLGLADPDGWVRFVTYREVNEVPEEKIQAVRHSLRARAAYWALKDSMDEDAGSNRWWAIQTLGKLGDLQAVKPLLAMVDNPDEVEREAAVRSLGLLGSRIKDPDLRQQVADRLIRLIEGPPEFSQIIAAEDLGHMGDPRALQVLPSAIRRTVNEGDSELPHYAAQGLGRYGPTALSVIQVLLEDPDPKVRQTALSALFALIQYHDDEKLTARVKKLIEKAAKDPDEDVRDEALSYLSWRFPSR